MQRHHLYTFGLLLGAIGLMIGGLSEWAEALKPSFIAGAMVAGGAVLKAMYQSSPQDS